jgi:U32 family peptidase
MHAARHAKPELLAPAGNLAHLEAALASGADAIYIGVGGLSARPQAWDFDWEQVPQAVRAVHDAGKRIYLALNAVWGEFAAERMTEHVRRAEQSGSDALIVGDWGLLHRLASLRLSVSIHGSTMLGAYNAAAVQLLQQLGVRRLILSTNLFLDEMAALVRGFPEMEFELIAHGGLCFNDNHRCRLPHEMRAGEYRVGCSVPFTVDVGCTGGDTYTVDLHMPDIDLSSTLPLYAALGIIAFKIEGRTRSVNYVANATRRLREALDRLPGEPTTEDGYVIHPGDFGSRY